MESICILKAPKTYAFIESEEQCFFCESNMLCVDSEGNTTHYKCGTCYSEWSVLGESDELL
jgi:hypothetical protein